MGLSGQLSGRARLFFAPLNPNSNSRGASSPSPSPGAASVARRSLLLTDAARRLSLRGSSSSAKAASASRSSTREHERLRRGEDALFSLQAEEWWNEAGPAEALRLYAPVRLAFAVQSLQTLPLFGEILRAERARRQERRKSGSGGFGGADEAKGVCAEALSSFPLRGTRVCDVGCGGGFLAEAAAKAGARVLGIDANAEMLRAAETRRARQGEAEKNRTLTEETAMLCCAKQQLTSGGEVCMHWHFLPAFPFRCRSRRL